MTRPQWRRLAHRVRALINSRPRPQQLPEREQLDLWAATDHREAAETRRTPWR